MTDETFHWTFRNVHADQTEAFLMLLEPLAATHGARLTWSRHPELGLLVRSDFSGEEAGRDFWLDLHERCNDLNLAMELAAEPAGPWQAWAPELGAEAVGAAPGPAASAALSMPALVTPAAAPPAAAPAFGLAHYRPEIPLETLYELLRQDDPELDGKLDATIAAIEDAGLPVINLLSYLDLPLFQEYAAEHPGEREQNLFLHMLHTWVCYRRFGAVHASVPAALAEALCDPRYLRVNTTVFQSPAPALCVQLPPWWCELRGAPSAPLQWVKEIYLTHFEPPTPTEDRELTLMIVTHDERGQYGFVPLEVPLSLPAVDQSIDAFFAPSMEDDELGANTQDLRRLTVLAAAYCLYATARDPRVYLPTPEETR